MAHAVVVVAVDGDHDGRGDLAEAVEHAVDAEVGADRRVHGTQRRRGQEHDERFGAVGEHCGHPVAHADSVGRQRPLARCHLGAQLAVRHRQLRCVLADERQGRVVGVWPARSDGPQVVLGDVQAGAGEELQTRAWRRATCCRGSTALRPCGDEVGAELADAVAELPHGAPERPWMLHGPRMQIRVGVPVEPESDLLGELPELRPRTSLGIRPPQHVCIGDCGTLAVC